MRRRNELIFNEMVNGATFTSPVFSSDDHALSLGEFDQLAIHVLVDKVSPAATTFELFIDHSADGRNWVPKNTAVGATTGGDVEITSLLVGSTNSAWGSDPGKLQNPPLASLGQIRFRMFFGAAGTTAQVKVYVTQRDQGG